MDSAGGTSEGGSLIGEWPDVGVRFKGFFGSLRVCLIAIAVLLCGQRDDCLFATLPAALIHQVLTFLLVVIALATLDLMQSRLEDTCVGLGSRLGFGFGFGLGLRLGLGSGFGIGLGFGWSRRYPAQRARGSN